MLSPTTKQTQQAKLDRARRVLSTGKDEQIQERLLP